MISLSINVYINFINHRQALHWLRELIYWSHFSNFILLKFDSLLKSYMDDINNPRSLSPLTPSQQFLLPLCLFSLSLSLSLTLSLTSTVPLPPSLSIIHIHTYTTLTLTLTITYTPYTHSLTLPLPLYTICKDQMLTDINSMVHTLYIFQIYEKELLINWWLIVWTWYYKKFLLF